jgi:DNA excision repair protein ERCC-5
MLLGGDYTEGIKGVGIVNAMEILQAFPVSSGVKEGLSEFRTWLDGFNPSEEIGDIDNTAASTNQNKFHKKHKSARSRWLAPKDFPAENVFHAYSKPVVDTSSEEFSWNIPDLENMKDFCFSKMGWEAAETERTLIPVIKEMRNSSKQTRLDGYFMRVEDNIKFADVRSKRLREVWNMKKK